MNRDEAIEVIWLSVVLRSLAKAVTTCVPLVLEHSDIFDVDNGTLVRVANRSVSPRLHFYTFC